jgi:hypothetical protein
MVISIMTPFPIRHARGSLPFRNVGVTNLAMQQQWKVVVQRKRMQDFRW